MSSDSQAAPLFADEAHLPPRDLGYDFFVPYEKQSFELYYGSEVPEKLELVSLTQSPASHGKKGERIPFSMIFRAASREFFVPQGIFPLVHPQAGRLDLFVVPIGPDDVGMQFQVVFN